MNRVLVTDVAIAAVVAVLILVLTPGLAISGVLGLVVLLMVGLSWLGGWWRRRSQRYRSTTRRGPTSSRGGTRTRV